MSDAPEREKQLIDRARNGSVDAFGALMRDYQDRLYRFLLVRGISSADAEDVVQETFLAAWQYLSSYRSRWRFSTWLFTIARRQASRRAKSLPEGSESPEQDIGPDQHADQLQIRDGLWALAGSLLTEDQFTALWLYYAEDADIREIARVVQRSRPWVKVNLHRARQKLADHLDHESTPARGRAHNVIGT